DTRLQGSALLTASTGATPTAGSTAVLPTELVGSTGRLTTAVLSADDAQGLLNVGIQTLYSMDTAPLAELTRPDDWFNTATSVASGATVATINAANAAKIVDHIYPSNLVVGGAYPSGTVNGANSGKTKLVAFGLGRQNSLITGVSPSNGTAAANPRAALMREAPVDGSFNSALMYNRLIVVFQVVDSGTGASSVTFAGVFGADGDLITDDAAALNGAVQ
ncbi:MAG TPA: hypothetical protein VG433_06140, partial [Pirellulales bacterium]|nr:hypothetical protein [Pirellulales bacterium]